MKKLFNKIKSFFKGLFTPELPKVKAPVINMDSPNLRRLKQKAKEIKAKK